MKPEAGDTMETELPLIERFSRALAYIVHEERPDALAGPITVAELYQDIAPYRRMRDLAGIEMHADYEHALIRLLAGEGGCARLEPESARDELALEAEAIDPDLSAYRKFAACELWLSLGERAPAMPVRAVAPPPPAEPLKFTAPPEIASDIAPADIQAASRDVAPAPPAAGPAREVASVHEIASALAGQATPQTPAATSNVASPASPSKAAVVTRCAFCGQRLPEHRDIRYCPFCGGDQKSRQCVACGERLEDDWRFCIACGASAEP